MVSQTSNARCTRRGTKTPWRTARIAFGQLQCALIVQEMDSRISRQAKIAASSCRRHIKNKMLRCTAELMSGFPQAIRSNIPINISIHARIHYSIVTALTRLSRMIQRAWSMGSLRLIAVAARSPSALYTICPS